MHAVTAVPTRPPDESLALPGDAQSAFVFVAITVPAVLAAAVGFINHTIGRRR
ncbi:hypothetical protein OG455_03740 [Kitasatospora sp. NBC_01287]|uniref:hypothetical protein n=1 Tax=Kitasatospora sp. NBC_01287 TaxID=2903573 RepID=UPI002251C06A|nr:hypothetical protein [Kitasatospora sp. NBC_01287]MCX4744642.1 hypothetical protein [Kitasatospora sp. NBC_01287]